MLLEVKNVTKTFRYGLFGFKFNAVDNVSFTMEDNPTILTIAGESGSGKSTLAKVILGVYKPDQGVVLYRGKNIHKLKGRERREFRKELQAVFQDPYATFNPFKKPYDYLRETVRNILGIKDAEETDKYIDSSLLLVGLRLEEIKGKYPHEFSGGELQRVSIARALLTKPRLILADEPVSMLDASLRVNVLNMFKDIKEKLKTSFIYITHDLATSFYISDYIAIMYRGMLVEQGPVERVFTEPHHPYTQMLIESVPEPNILKRKTWMKPVKLSGIEEKEYTTTGCRYAARCPYSKPKCLSSVPPDIHLSNGVTVKCWLYE